MKMFNKKGFVFGLSPAVFFIAAGALLLLIPFVSGGGGGSGGGGVGPAKVFSCDIDIDEKFFGSFNLEGVSCVVTDRKNSCGFSLGFLSEKGKVQVQDSTGIIASKNFETPVLGDSVTVTLKDCTLDNSVTIRLLDDNENLVDSRTVTLTGGPINGLTITGFRRGG